MKITKVRILLFDDVELLDFAGPMEIWSATDYLLQDQHNIDVQAISRKKEIIVAKSQLKVSPHICGVDDSIDVLIIPGGLGTRAILKSDEELQYIRSLVDRSKIICSVCTGALVLARLNLLKGLRVTTHHLLLKELKELSPTSEVDPHTRFIDQECIITSGGVSAGIDMSLYMVEKYFDSSLKYQVAEYIEYPIREE